MRDVIGEGREIGGEGKAPTTRQERQRHARQDVEKLRRSAGRQPEMGDQRGRSADEDAVPKRPQLSTTAHQTSVSGKPVSGRTCRQRHGDQQDADERQSTSDGGDHVSRGWQDA